MRIKTVLTKHQYPHESGGFYVAAGFNCHYLFLLLNSEETTGSDATVPTAPSSLKGEGRQ